MAVCQICTDNSYRDNRWNNLNAEESIKLLYSLGYGSERLYTMLCIPFDHSIYRLMASSPHRPRAIVRSGSRLRLYSRGVEARRKSLFLHAAQIDGQHLLRGSQNHAS